jgi:MFS family permease
VHPASRPYRFIILAFAALMAFGSYFAYDSVGAIETTLIQVFHTDRAAIGTMYTMYSVAAVLAVLAGGFLIDRVGVRRASLIFSSFVVVGAAMVAAAPSLPVMYAGRVLFGIGSESMIVAQSAITARWFTGKELAMAFGITLTIARLGTLFSFNTEELLASRFGWRGALWIAVALCLFSLLCNWIYTLMDRRAEPILRLPEAGSGDKIAWSDIGKFRPSYWFAVGICVTFYSAIFPFTALATDFFHDKWGMKMASGEGLGFFAGVFYNLTHMFTTAQGATSIIIAASMVLAPFAGNFVDRLGRRASLMVVGASADGTDALFAGDVDDRFGRRFRASPSLHLALGPAHRGSATRGHRVWGDDRHPKYRSGDLPAGQRSTARLDTRLHRQPDYVRNAGLLRSGLLHPAAARRSPRRRPPGARQLISGAGPRPGCPLGPASHAAILAH